MNTTVPSPFKNPAFRHLFAAQVTSLLGTGITTIALALLAWELAAEDAGRVLGTALALKMIAYVGIAPIAGGLAHRLPRRSTLVVLDLIRAGLICTLPFLTEVWQLYLVIVAVNACSACFTPLFQATLPDLLPNEERYTRALSWSRLAYDLENLLSPTLAALLLGVISFSGLFLIDALTFLLSALLVATALLPKPKPSERSGSAWQQIMFGVRGYLKTPRLRGLLALHGVVACGGAMVIVNSVVYVRNQLGLGEQQVAWVMTAAGTGSMLIALLIPKLLLKIPDRPVMMVGALLISIALVLGISTPGYTGVMMIWFLLGAGWSCIQTPAARIVTRSAAEGDRAAYFSANFALSHAAWFIGYCLAGWLGAGFGLEQTFAILALLSVLATLAAWKLWPASDPVVMEHVHHAHHHRHLHYHDEQHHQHEHEGWEGPEPHEHEHRHREVRHSHPFVIDAHHLNWPGGMGR